MRLTSDIRRFANGIDLAAIVGASLASLAAGILLGVMIEHQAQCPKLINRVVTHRTNAAPTMVLQAGGIWETQRRVEITQREAAP